MIPTADAVLNRLGLQRWRTGHPWIFRNGIDHVEEDEGSEPIARVLGPRGKVLGYATLSRQSQITLRRLDTEEEVSENYFGERLERASQLPARHAERPACRLVFGESDGLPGLVVDRYENHLVAQFLSEPMEQLTDILVRQLQRVFSPVSILARNDAAVRALEGLERTVTPLFGETPDQLRIQDGDYYLAVAPKTGQKTGAFLDQVPNYHLASRLAKGRVLDAFCNSGGFARAAAKSSTAVLAMDTSTEALSEGQRLADEQGLDGIEFVEGNVFDFLRHCDREKESFDTIILDPPAFAKSKKEIDGAMRGYKEINLRAMKILAPGGTLMTFSCSYHLTEPLMLEVLNQAAADARKAFRIVDRPLQASDHPIRIGFPESHYLKCFVLETIRS